MAPSGSTSLTILVRGKEFHLSYAQIQFDAPNVFSDFVQDVQAGTDNSNGILHLDVNPEIFALIVEYMSGYTILPVPLSAIPRFLTMKTFMAGLKKDAGELRLSGLQSLLRKSMDPAKALLEQCGYSHVKLTLFDVLENRVPPGSTNNRRGLRDRAGQLILIHTRNIIMKVMTYRTDIVIKDLRINRGLYPNEKQPTYTLDPGAHSRPDVLIYGQTAQDAIIEIDGKAVSPMELPIGLLLVEEAWMTIDACTIHQKDYEIWGPKIISMKARSKTALIAEMEIDELTVDADEITLRD